jgi:hypothetical protein
MAIVEHLRGRPDSRLNRALDLRSATVEGALTLARLHLAAAIHLSDTTIGELRLVNVTGLGHVTFGPDRTRIGVLTVRCQGDDEVLEVQHADIRERVRVEDTRVRRLSFLRCCLGAELRLKSVDVRHLELRDSTFEHMRSEDVTVEARLTVRDCLAKRMDWWNFTIEGFLDVSSPASLDLYRGDVGGPARLVWVPPRPLLEKAQSEWGLEAVPPGLGQQDEADTKLLLNFVRFGSAAQLRWCGGDVGLRSTVFTDASRLSGARDAGKPPRLESVHDLDGEELRISGVRTDECLLSEAVALGPIEAAALPFGRGAVGRTDRHFIADERHLGGAGETEWALRLAATYRDLRTSLETVGEYAGANELHYGERLWQRVGAARTSERWWLTAYRVVGYGVRPWRPFALLLLLLAVASLLFGALGGLDRVRLVDGAKTESTETLCDRDTEPTSPGRAMEVTCPASFGDRVEFGFRATTTLVRPVGEFRTHGVGSVLEIATRLLAALLFGLFLLAIRNRVRR